MTDEEEFYAWLDGELDEAASQRVAARVAADPGLGAMADRHRRMGAGLRGAFDPVLSDVSHPPRFQSAEVVDLTERRARRVAFAVPQWAAMAATLVLGLVVGTVWKPEPTGPLTSRDGAVYAAASLDQALNTQLASAGPAGAVKVGLTFRDRGGAICRTFSGDVGEGLACRDKGAWRVEGLVGGAHQATDYRMAAGEDPALAAMIDRKIAGEPLDAKQEADARASGWR